MALGETEEIWQRAEGASCPQNPSSPGLSGCSELMETSQSPDSPTGKWQADQGEPGRQKSVKGRAGQDVWRPAREASPGLRDRALHLQRLRSRWDPAPRKNPPSGKGFR